MKPIIFVSDSLGAEGWRTGLITMGVLSIFIAGELGTKKWKQSKIIFLKAYFFLVKDNYPKLEYSEAGIINDTKNILHQIFVKKYCKQM